MPAILSPYLNQGNLGQNHPSFVEDHDHFVCQATASAFEQQRQLQDQQRFQAPAPAQLQQQQRFQAPAPALFQQQRRFQDPAPAQLQLHQQQRLQAPDRQMEDMQFTPVCFLDTKKEKRKEKKGSGSNKVKATWNDCKHALFIRICLEQMRLGNRHSHTLNKEGYINLEKEFLRESGLHYNQLQFKNHWDSTRRDWKAWTALRNSTDVAWDTNKNTYSQTAEWWADFSLKYPGAAKFADQPLTHVEELDQLFGDGFEKGELVAVPILGNTIHKYITDSENEIMVDDEDKESDALEENETTSTPTGSTNVPPSPLCSAGCSSTPIDPSRAGGPTPAQPLKHREPLPSIPRPEKRAKRVASVKWEASLKQICELLAERTKRLASFATEDSNPISNAMDLLNEVTEIERNSDEWLFTASLLRDQSNRQLFVALGNPGSRLAWIRREYRLAHH